MSEGEERLGEDLSPPPSAGEPGIPPQLREDEAAGAEEGDAEAIEDGDAATVEHPMPGGRPVGPLGGEVSVAAAVPEPPPVAAETPAAVPEAALPGFAVADTPLRGTTPLADAEEFIERAIESVLEQVPDVAGEEPEGSAKLQPWAETAAPAGKNKRPLSELLDQYAARVAAAPDAVAGRPRGQHPIAAFFARFTPQRGGRSAEGAGGGGGRGGKRRRGRRGAPQGGVTQAAPQARPQQPGNRPPRGPRPATTGGAAPDGGVGQNRSRRRRRRGRGGGGGGGPAPS